MYTGKRSSATLLCALCTAGGMVLLTGCAKSGAEGWAQTGPVLRAEAGESAPVVAKQVDASSSESTTTAAASVNLGMRDG